MPAEVEPQIGTLAQWVGVGATLLAVLAALFKEELIRIWRRPQLNLLLALYPPHSHKTQMHQKNGATVTASADCYFVRAWVENTGKARAAEVQVFISELSERGSDGLFHEIDGFLPMNLTWAHSGEVFAAGISPHMGKHCDFGYVLDPKFRKRFGVDKEGASDDAAIFALSVEFPAATKGHLVLRGTYRIKFLVAGSNTDRPVEREYEMTISGNWYDKSARMFSDGISILPLN